MTLAVDIQVPKKKTGLFGSSEVSIETKHIEDYREWLLDNNVKIDEIRQASRFQVTVWFPERETISLGELKDVTQGFEMMVTSIKQPAVEHVQVVDRPKP